MTKLNTYRAGPDEVGHFGILADVLSPKR